MDGIVPTSRDRRWLADACATADRIADLEAALVVSRGACSVHNNNW